MGVNETIVVMCPIINQEVNVFRVCTKICKYFVEWNEEEWKLYCEVDECLK